MTPSPCALGCARRDGTPYPAAPGYVLCDRCSRRTRDTIRDIVDAYHVISVPMALLREQHGPTRHSPGFRSTSPGSDHVIALRDPRTVAVDPGDPRSAHEVLHGWARSVRVALGLRGPDVCSVDSEASTLLFHWDWITRQYTPDSLRQLAGELTEVRTQLRAANGDLMPLAGHCQRAVNGTLCGRRLYQPANDPRVVCPGCHTSYNILALIMQQADQEEEAP